MIILIGLVLIVPIAVTILIFKSRKPGSIAKKYQNTEEQKSVYVKKFEEADIERYRGLFLRVGYAVVLGVLLLLLALTPEKSEPEALVENFMGEDIEMEPPVTSQPPPPPPTPPPPPEIEVVEDKEEPEKPVEIFDTEVKEKVPIPDIPPPPPPEPEPEQPQIFRIVEEMPEFPGGTEALYKFIYKNISYPVMAKENNIEGTVYVQFVVNEDGSVAQVEVLRGPGGGLDEEAVKVIKMLPKWKPGKQRGKPVKVYFNVPVKFKLQ